MVRAVGVRQLVVRVQQHIQGKIQLVVQNSARFEAREAVQGGRRELGVRQAGSGARAGRQSAETDESELRQADEADRDQASSENRGRQVVSGRQTE